jgi:hypothetical protein
MWVGILILVMANGDARSAAIGFETEADCRRIIVEAVEEIKKHSQVRSYGMACLEEKALIRQAPTPKPAPAQPKQYEPGA